MKKTIRISMILVFLLALTTSVVFAGPKARRPAIIDASNRVVELQRTDTDWEGTWYWYVGSTGNATNLTGVTALGLLEAYNDTKDPAYLTSAENAANFIITHLGVGATGTQYSVRTTAVDIVFLHELSKVTGDPSYAQRATLEWANLTSYWPTAGDLDTLFRAIPRRSAWDIAFFLEAAYLSGDTVWADQAAMILADLNDTFYYGTDTWWFPLNVAGSIRALIYSGYGEIYRDEINTQIYWLMGLVDDDTGVGGYIQDTSYAVIAFRIVGGAAHRYANDLARWISVQQADNGGWLEAGDEYPEIDGEALRALSSTIGTNNTIDGFDYGSSQVMNSSWVRNANSDKAVPFNGE